MRLTPLSSSEIILQNTILNFPLHWDRPLDGITALPRHHPFHDLPGLPHQLSIVHHKQLIS